MAKVRIEKELKTSRTVLKVGREVLVNWRDAYRLQQLGIVTILS